MAPDESFQTQDLGLDFESSIPDTAHKDVRPSMLYQVLPAIVQNRIPTLPSLRRSIGELRGRAVHVKSPSTVSDTSAPRTPPPRYSSRAGSIGPNRASVVSTDTEEIEFRDDLSEPAVSAISTPPPFPIFETKTGINWKYANQGISLITQAYQESNALARDADDTPVILTRQLYLHGMTYLLRGIPAELSPEEELSLQAAIPQSLINVVQDPDAHALVALDRSTAIKNETNPQDASILHRITAVVVFQTFVLIQFLLPYIKLFIGHAYRLEREHKVTQRLVNRSISTVDELGRRTLALSQTVCQMNDGKVGQAINDLTFWWVRGLTGGIQQGITDGVLMIGSERPQSPKGRVEKIE